MTIHRETRSTFVLIAVILTTLVNEAYSRLNYDIRGHHQFPLRLNHQNVFECQQCSLGERSHVTSAVEASEFAGGSHDVDANANGDMQRFVINDAIMQLTRYHGNKPTVREPSMTDQLDDVTSSGDETDVAHRRVDDIDNLLMSFPYCSGLTMLRCRILHRHLEQLVNVFTHRNLVDGDGRMTLISVRSRQHSNRFKRAISTSATSSELSENDEENKQEIGDNEKWERHRDNDVMQHKGNDVPDKGRLWNFKNVEGVEYERRAKLTDGVRSSIDTDSAKNQVLRRYRQLRHELGYGQQNARWGRSVHRLNADDVINTEIPIRSRKKRSLVVEIQWPSDEELSDEEKDMLDAYLLWREQYGYGTLAGRWG